MFRNLFAGGQIMNDPKQEIPPVEYWHWSDSPGLLSCTTLDEAIEEYVDCECEPGQTLPESKNFYGYATPKAKLSGVLEWVLERLDEDYLSDLDDSPTEQTEEMQAAETQFIERILSLYEVRCCKRVTETQVNVAEWEKERQS